MSVLLQLCCGLYPRRNSNQSALRIMQFNNLTQATLILLNCSSLWKTNMAYSDKNCMCHECKVYKKQMMLQHALGSLLQSKTLWDIARLKYKRIHTCSLEVAPPAKIRDSSSFISEWTEFCVFRTKLLLVHSLPIFPRRNYFFRETYMLVILHSPSMSFQLYMGPTPIV